jgi:hypothetical protein
MQYYHFTLIGLALLAIASAWNVPRAVLWIALGAVFYVASAMWHNAGFSYGAAFGAGTNLVMCYLFWIRAEQRYEMRFWNFYHLMLVVDLLYIFGWIKDHEHFAIALEIINAIALLFIIATGLMERAYGISSGSARVRRNSLVYRALWAERSAASRPWWQRRHA